MINSEQPEMEKHAKKSIVIAVTNDLVSDNRIHKIAMTLLNMGFTVTLAGRKFHSGRIKLSRPYKTRRFSLWFNKGPLFYANYNIKLFFYLLIKQFDVIVSNDLDTLTACFYASRIKQKPIVYDSHEYFTEVPELVSRPGVKRIWENIERSILPKLRYCYTVSQSIADIYNQKYGTSFRVVRNIPFKLNTLNNDGYIPPFPTDKPVIIYQGAVNLGRGIEEAILAMHLVENAILVIIGSGDLIDKCKELTTNEQLTDKVIFTGRITFEELRKLTGFAAIGLSVEKDFGLNYRYALPNKVFDYIQSEVPLLVSSLPEIKMIVEKYRVGLVIEETSPVAIANGIKEMLGDDALYLQWKQNCRAAKTELCWEIEEKTIIDIFNQFE
jgi:glycosyltransferase involved in cell wall biosynthesis